MADLDAVRISDVDESELRLRQDEDGRTTIDAPPKKSRFLFMRFPTAVWFIICNELCERFSFYGFKAILALYLRNYLGIHEETATAVVHAFIFAAYATPLFGGWLADSVLGKFWTILILSIVYCIGNVVTSITAIPYITGYPPHWWGVVVGLLLVAIGTGGIKPCVSSFGGDQFEKSDTDLMQSFFAMFYFSINLGSVISTFVTPVVRDQFGYHWAFALPACLLVVATLIFVSGKRFYKVTPPAGNVFKTLASVVFSALKQRLKAGYVQSAHWLDRATAEHSEQVVEDVKTVLSVMRCLVPLVMFWALFDQHSSRWVFQAERMDRNVGSWLLAPEQITILNPLLVLIMVPLFDRIIYPLLRRCRVKLFPLRRITVGFLFAGLSFIASALLELWMQHSPEKSVHVAAQIPQYIILCVGEILVSVTALEFAYSQAPVSMKSVMQSFYLLTTAMGNVIVVIVAGSRIFDNVMWEYFFFAALMFAFTVLFLLLVRTYQYRNVKYDDVEFEQ